MSIFEKRRHTLLSECINMVAKFEISELTSKEFREQEGLSSKTFYRWRKRVQAYKAKKAVGKSEYAARFAKGEAVEIKASLQDLSNRLK